MFCSILFLIEMIDRYVDGQMIEIRVKNIESGRIQVQKIFLQVGLSKRNFITHLPKHLGSIVFNQLVHQSKAIY